MSTPREEMLEHVLAEYKLDLDRYARLVGSIKEWAEMTVVFGRAVDIPDNVRLAEIRKLLDEYDAERRTKETP